MKDVLELSSNSTKKTLLKLREFQTSVLGSVAGPVIHANERLRFEGDLRSGGLLYFVSH